MTVDALAQAVGVAKSSVSRAENGVYVPSDPVIATIAARCCVQEHWLRTGEGPMLLEDATPPNPAAPVLEDPELVQIATWWKSASPEDRTWFLGQLRRHAPEVLGKGGKECGR